MKTETIRKLVYIITYTERNATLKAVDRFLAERQYRRGVADPDVMTLRDMVRERWTEIA